MTIEELCEKAFETAKISKNWAISGIRETKDDYIISIKPRGDMGCVMPIAIDKKTYICRTYYITKETYEVMTNAKQLQIPEKYKDSDEET